MLAHQFTHTVQIRYMQFLKYLLYSTNEDIYRMQNNVVGKYNHNEESILTLNIKR